MVLSKFLSNIEMQSNQFFSCSKTDFLKYHAESADDFWIDYNTGSDDNGNG